MMNSRPKKVEDTLPSVENRILSGLQEFLGALKGGAKLDAEFRDRRVKLQLDHTPFSARKVAATRKLLGVDQSLLAHFLGVSPNTVRAWENGTREPNLLASRFLNEIRRNPEYWRKRISESLIVNAG